MATSFANQKPTPAETKHTRSALVILTLTQISPCHADSRLTDRIRRIVLDANNSSVILGRASKTRGLLPAKENLWIDNPIVTKEHARFVLGSDAAHPVTLRDLNSTHGTWVGDHQIMTDYPLQDGDMIKIGVQVKANSQTFEPNIFMVEADWQKIRHGTLDDTGLATRKLAPFSSYPPTPDTVSPISEASRFTVPETTDESDVVVSDANDAPTSSADKTPTSPLGTRAESIHSRQSSAGRNFEVPYSDGESLGSEDSSSDEDYDPENLPFEFMSESDAASESSNEHGSDWDGSDSSSSDHLPYADEAEEDITLLPYGPQPPKIPDTNVQDEALEGNSTHHSLEHASNVSVASMGSHASLYMQADIEENTLQAPSSQTPAYPEWFSFTNASPHPVGSSIFRPSAPVPIDSVKSPADPPVVNLDVDEDLHDDELQEISKSVFDATRHIDKHQEIDSNSKGAQAHLKLSDESNTFDNHLNDEYADEDWGARTIVPDPTTQDKLARHRAGSFDLDFSSELRTKLYHHKTGPKMGDGYWHIFDMADPHRKSMPGALLRVPSPSDAAMAKPSLPESESNVRVQNSASGTKRPESSLKDETSLHSKLYTPLSTPPHQITKYSEGPFAHDSLELYTPQDSPSEGRKSVPRAFSIAELINNESDAEKPRGLKRKLGQRVSNMSTIAPSQQPYELPGTSKGVSESFPSLPTEATESFPVAMESQRSPAPLDGSDYIPVAQDPQVRLPLTYCRPDMNDYVRNMCRHVTGGQVSYMESNLEFFLTDTNSNKSDAGASDPDIETSEPDIIDQAVEKIAESLKEPVADVTAPCIEFPASMDDDVSYGEPMEGLLHDLGFGTEDEDEAQEPPRKRQRSESAADLTVCPQQAPRSRRGFKRFMGKFVPFMAGAAATATAIFGAAGVLISTMPDDIQQQARMEMMGG